jgi:hypothetical protein
MNPPRSGGWNTNDPVIDPLSFLTKSGPDKESEGGSLEHYTEMFKGLAQLVGFEVALKISQSLLKSLGTNLNAHVVATLVSKPLGIAKGVVFAIVERSVVFKAMLPILAKLCTGIAELLDPLTWGLAIAGIAFFIWDMVNPTYKEVKFTASILDDMISNINRMTNQVYGVSMCGCCISQE